VRTFTDWEWRNVSDKERWGSLALGAAAVAFGLSRRSKPATWLAATAAPFLIHRGLTGHCYAYSAMGLNTAEDAMDTRTALGGSRGVHVRESVRIEKPVEELYRFWRDFENLPRFMSNLVEVKDLGGGRSRWVAKGPGGYSVEWEAEIINEVENEVIGWRSLPDSDIATAGSVTFKPARGGTSSEIAVNLQYSPPAGRAGNIVAWLFGRNPAHTIREDLRRLKQLIEAGEIARATPAAVEEVQAEAAAVASWPEERRR
jgi:uncharacterized membrane protein